jgi:hypothetical protein
MIALSGKAIPIRLWECQAWGTSVCDVFLTHDGQWAFGARDENSGSKYKIGNRGFPLEEVPEADVIALCNYTDHTLPPPLVPRIGEAQQSAPGQGVRPRRKRGDRPADIGAHDDRNHSEPSLSEDQRYLLVATLELSAFDSDSRRTAAQIVDGAKGRFADPPNAKKALAGLVRKNPMESKRGSQGGYWLTTKGKHRSERLQRVNPSKE